MFLWPPYKASQINRAIRKEQEPATRLGSTPSNENGNGSYLYLTRMFMLYHVNNVDMEQCFREGLEEDMETEAVSHTIRMANLRRLPTVNVVAVVVIAVSHTIRMANLRRLPTVNVVAVVVIAVSHTIRMANLRRLPTVNVIV